MPCLHMWLSLTLWNPGTLIIGLLIIAAIFSWSCSRPPKVISFPDIISNVSNGYTFALRIKNGVSGNANLTAVIVDLDRIAGNFRVEQISYGFASPKTNGRVFSITVDNTKREAYVSMDAPVSPDSPYMPRHNRAPLDLSTIRKDISEILTIAKTNGLDEFCSLASPQQGNVDLRLYTGADGPVWSVIGDGWDEKGPIADLAIVIDDRNGEVISHTLQKAVHR